MRVLITNISLASRSGTEVVVLELAPALARAGVEVAVYTPAPGVTAQELQSRGVVVTGHLATLPPPDIVHGHHHVETVEALLRFPQARGLFVCHDASIWHDRPPDLAPLLRYVAVDRCVEERLMRYPFVRERGVTFLPNAVDTDKYKPRSALPRRPKRALIFSNYLKDGEDLALLRRVCADRGIALDTAGEGTATGTTSAESILPQYDIVFAKARCALEAAACGCFVVLYHNGMLAAPLDEGNIAECLWNLGRRLFTEPLTEAALKSRLDGYSRRTAQHICEEVRKTRALADLAGQWLALYNEIMALPLPSADGWELRRYMEGMVKAAESPETEPPPPPAPRIPDRAPPRVRWWTAWAGKRR